jgi:hypothetical protein
MKHLSLKREVRRVEKERRETQRKLSLCMQEEGERVELMVKKKVEKTVKDAHAYCQRRYGIYTYVCLYMYMCICVYMYMFIYVCVNIYTCLCVHICTCMCVYIGKHDIYIYIYIYFNIQCVCG